MQGGGGGGVTAVKNGEGGQDIMLQNMHLNSFKTDSE